jgi:quercetin dioxygenase-like cupin family protein
MPKINIQNSNKVNQDLDAFKYYDDGCNEIVLLNLKPGEEIQEHKNPLFVLFYVSTGKVTIWLDGQMETLEQSDMLPVLPTQQRAMKNTGDEHAQILVIKQK